MPEGVLPLSQERLTLDQLREAMDHQTVLEGLAVRCDGRRDLFVRFGGHEGVIPRLDAVHPAVSGADRHLAVLQRAVSCRLTASGGISCNGEICRLRDMGLHAAIIGKAYYTGAIDLAQAVKDGGPQ